MRPRPSLFLLAALTAAATPATSQGTPPLQALQGFQPGKWQTTPLGTTVSESLCLASVEPLLTGSRPAAQCTFTTISDDGTNAVITYRCAGGRSGRTAIRRDTAVLYTIDAQGLEASLPFSSRAEWRRTGAC